MVFHLVNEAGNCHRYTENARKRDLLMQDGYVVEVTAEKTKTAAKKAKAKAGDAE